MYPDRKFPVDDGPREENLKLPVVRAFQTLLRLFSSDELFTIYYKNINCIEDERKGNLSSQTDINCSRAWLFIRVQQLYNT